jgi:hypothetical protein
VWDTGSIVYDEAFAEDGADHPLGGQGATQSISVLQDGGRRIVSSSGKGGRYAVSICHVSPDAMTMTCQGELHTPDGRAGAFQCGYHRDDAAPPAPAATAP